MAKEIFKSTIKKRGEAAKAIIKAEMGATQKRYKTARVYLDKSDGEIVTVFGEFKDFILNPNTTSPESRMVRDSQGVLLWNVEGPRDVSEIYAMEMALDAPGLKNITWIEHYLTIFFEEVIAWEFETGKEK